MQLRELLGVLRARWRTVAACLLIVVGVTAAWYLAQDGHEVTVVDRHDGAALETSFANGGQVSGW